ncbi:putative peptidoglycan glycosyltransferase FtsW [Campylobacter majalis]|uniref:Probable peptidoglycan glycosyltransferase FtsW n=1 Tax=Campylobacter majalis TaxID=2790656 RepID=A0ABM8Q4I9_9BACT|nr:FtsW/RodA/SpoVE family cell cycle protein [Campylobacter majalis]CAD7287697.1 putative peptidoglycan glycosyltransferase FtsW [Campylobacter majalis]
MQADKSLFFTSTILMIVGVVFSLSLSVFAVLLFNYTEYHFFIRQFGVVFVGIFVMWAISLLNPDKALFWIGFGLFFSCFIAMSVMYVLPASMVTEAGGARRWIRLPGFSLAPVEFFKIGFVYFLAWSFSRKIDDSKKTILAEVKILFPYFIVFIIIVYLIAVLQNDLGQVVVLGATLICMAYFAGASLRIFSIILTIAIGVFTVIIVTSDHRIARLKSWWGSVQDFMMTFMPEAMAQALRVDNAPEPYQVMHSLNAIRHGEFWGEGLGAGIIKLGFLSEVHTDFVLAGIAEEAGFAGIFCVVMLFSWLIYRIFLISSRSENKVFHLFSLGIGMLISLSFIINSYGISSIIPIKGIAVPFLSYGGSQILASCIAIGMILMISKRANI